MKLSLACVLLTAATAMANPTPAQQGDWPKKGLPPGWEYTEDTRDGYGPRITIPPPTPVSPFDVENRRPSECIARCMRSKHKAAGCGHAEDWDCLCRYDGLAPEIQNCANRFCHSEKDIGSLALQNLICRETVGVFTGHNRPPPPPPPRRGN